MNQDHEENNLVLNEFVPRFPFQIPITVALGPAMLSGIGGIKPEIATCGEDP